MSKNKLWDKDVAVWTLKTLGGVAIALLGMTAIMVGFAYLASILGWPVLVAFPVILIVLMIYSVGMDRKDHAGN